MKLNNIMDFNFQVTPEQMAKLQIVPREDDPDTWMDYDPE